MKLNKYMNYIQVQYPISIYWIKETNGSGYFFAYYPDFGHSACSAVGDTKEEVLEELEAVKCDVIRHYLDSGIDLPEPSKAPI